MEQNVNKKFVDQMATQFDWNIFSQCELERIVSNPHNIANLISSFIEENTPVQQDNPLLYEPGILMPRFFLALDGPSNTTLKRALVMLMILCLPT